MSEHDREHHEQAPQPCLPKWLTEHPSYALYGFDGSDVEGNRLRNNTLLEFQAPWSVEDVDGLKDVLVFTVCSVHDSENSHEVFDFEDVRLLAQLYDLDWRITGSEYGYPSIRVEFYPAGQGLLGD